MKNPTEQELMEFVDGTLSSQRAVEIEILISHSSRLQQEVALLRRMNDAVKNQIVLPSKKFSTAVMSEIFPSRNETWAFRFIKNSSNVFATVLALFFIGIIFLPSSENSHNEFTVIPGSIIENLSLLTKQIIHPINNAVKTSFGEIVIIGFAVFVLFIFADEILGKKFFYRR